MQIIHVFKIHVMLTFLLFLIVRSMKGGICPNDIVMYLNEVWYSWINMRHIKGLYL